MAKPKDPQPVPTTLSDLRPGRVVVMPRSVIETRWTDGLVIVTLDDGSVLRGAPADAVPVLPATEEG